MSIRIAAIIFLFSLVALPACIPGSDRSEPITYTDENDKAPLEARASDWFMHNKVERLPYDPLPPRDEDGSLPRSLGTYSLLGTAPTEGKKYRDGQKIFYVEEITKNRRIRVFSRDGSIFRVQAFTRLTDIVTRDSGGLVQMIKDEYGSPDREFPNELTYVDNSTVLQFSISDEFLVSDIMDIATCELPEHIVALVEKSRNKR